MRRVSEVGVEGGSWAGMDGGEQGREGGDGCGGGPEIRRRLRGGGLIPGDGIVLFRQDVMRCWSCCGRNALIWQYQHE